MNDQWTPATTHVVIATPSGNRYWDDLATRVPYLHPNHSQVGKPKMGVKYGDPDTDGNWDTFPDRTEHPSGAPLLDWWEIPEGEPMTTRYLIGDVFERLAEIPDGSVDLVVTSPPFLALRSYLPADHPDKSREIGSEPTPAAFIDVMLAVTAELRRVLAPHGSIAVELGDTYAGSGGGGGDYLEGGWREGQAQFAGSGDSMRESNAAHWRQKNRSGKDRNEPGYGSFTGGSRDGASGGPGWPLAKSRTMIPQLYEVALAYGLNPLTGEPSPAGRWRVRNVVTWCRPNPPVGALSDKWRPATSDVVVACVSDKRYWDDLATRKNTNDSHASSRAAQNRGAPGHHTGDDTDSSAPISDMTQGAPLLDYWVIPPKGYSGAHYAVYPQELVVPLVKAMVPQRVCRVCGEPSRRIVETTNAIGKAVDHSAHRPDMADRLAGGEAMVSRNNVPTAEMVTLGFTDCGHNDYRPGQVLDPFAGSGTTLAVAHGHGHDSVGIDLDARNAELAQGRLGLFLEVEAPDAAT